jgi:hypothetical protein
MTKFLVVIPGKRSATRNPLPALDTLRMDSGSAFGMTKSLMPQAVI